jgi:molybdate transport system substrate-binding protein
VSEFARSLRLLLLLLLVPSAVFAQNRLVHLAAAADLQPVLPPILQQFQQKTGVEVQASYQSSATLATQIINGAPFDLFLAANMDYPRKVIEAGRGAATEPTPYAQGALVLWTRNDSGVRDLSLDGLRDASVKSIAIANPQHAPYGRAAQQTLEHLGLTAAVKPRLVVAENIAQAAQYADSGNAQVGFISLTSASTPRLRADGHFLRVPESDYTPLVQGAIVIRNAPAQADAERLLKFLAEPAVRSQLAQRGLEPPPSDAGH